MSCPPDNKRVIVLANLQKDFTFFSRQMTEVGVKLALFAVIT